MHLDREYAEGTLGVDVHFEDKPLAILKRANFNWVMSKFAARWYLVEREEGKFTFDDAGIARAKRAKMMVMLQALNPEWGRQKWLLPYCRPEGGGAWEAVKRDHYVKAWGRFMEKVVGHYKRDVKYWEIENEPASLFSAADYAAILNETVVLARRADPEARIVGFSGGGYNAAYYEEVIKLIEPKAVDVFSVHFYGGIQSDTFAEYGGLLKKYQKKGWNTETGTTCPTFFTTLPEYDALRQKDYWDELQKEIRSQTVHTVQNYLLTMSVGGMERYFHYFGRFVNSGPSQPTSRFGSGKEITEFDGSLRANGVGLCIASHFIDGAAYDGRLEVGEGVEGHVFRKGTGCIGFLWGRAEKKVEVAVPEGVTCYDIMGNVVDRKVIALTDSVVYFRFGGDVGACKELWKGRVK
jgi:hypothetical protein